MKILFVASEVAPFAKTGGLADVAAALPRALARAGHDVRVFLPLYDRIDPKGFEIVVDSLDCRLAGAKFQARILRSGPFYFVHCPELYHRGAIYTADPDEHRRFLLLSWASLIACDRLNFTPDVVHCNDWQSALIPMTLKAHSIFPGAKTLLTIHNLAYQGSFPATVQPETNVPARLFHQELVAAGRINFLLQGILYADGVSTVSPTYAREIQTPEHGNGLDPFLRARTSTVVGILNGVDYDDWSPEKDKHLTHRFSAADLAGKERSKEELLTKLGLPYLAGVPVIGIVSRLAKQKGFELLAGVMPDLLRRHGFQLVVLGNGEGHLQEMFTRFQLAFPRQVTFYQGFSEPLAHLIEAGSDMFLMPSVYEPCGLNQMYSLRYGTVPIVHKTGGLADTVTPQTGFAFERHDAAGLQWAIEAALTAYKTQPAWARLVQNGMSQDFSWEAQRKVYETLYTRLVA